jgi:hypothetical protein
VDRGTGRPEWFDDNGQPYVLAANTTERWFRFATLGDGKAGNWIRLHGQVNADLVDANGGVLAAGQQIFDMQSIPAGVYYLRAYGDQASFTIEVMAPIRGQSHENATLPDRDTLRGGDGDDTLIGNHDLDYLYGDSGTDSFTGEKVEIRDFGLADIQVIGPVSVPELSFGNPFPLTDPAIGTSQMSGALRAAIARALGYPVTTDFQGNPLVHQPLYTSELATITSLDASNLGISDLSGIEHLVNLEWLNLAGNSLGGIQLQRLVPDRSTGILLGMPRLLHLDLSNNVNLTDISVLGQLSGLQSLDLQGTNAAANLSTTTSTIEKLTQLSHLTLPTSLLVSGQELAYQEGQTIQLSLAQPHRGLLFDGTTDFVDLPNVSSNLSGGLTFELWAYPTAAGTWAKFIDLGNGQANNSILFGRNGSSNNLALQVFIGGNYSGAAFTTGSPIELNQWQHFAVTLGSDGGVQFYKDGNLLPSAGSTDAPLNVVRTNNFIGKSSFSSDALYQGRMDNVRIYNRPLSAAEILANRDSAVANSNGLVGDWRFDEGTGTTASDSSGVSGNAVLVGPPDWVSPWVATGNSIGTLTGSGPIHIATTDDGIISVAVDNSTFPILVSNAAPEITRVPSLFEANGGFSVNEGQVITVHKIGDGQFELHVDGAAGTLLEVADSGTADLPSIQAQFSITDPSGVVTDLSRSSLRFDNELVTIPSRVLEGQNVLTATFSLITPSDAVFPQTILSGAPSSGNSPQGTPPVLVPVEEGGAFDQKNLALSGTAFAKDVLLNGAYAEHQKDHLNDGLYGNSHSWIGNSAISFAGISLGQTPVTIQSLAFGRSNVTNGDPCPGGACTDRVNGTYVLEYTTVENPNQDTTAWTSIGTFTYSANSLENPHLRHRFDFAPISATGVRVRMDSGAESFIAIDEIELYAERGANSIELSLENATTLKFGYGNDQFLSFTIPAVANNVLHNYVVIRDPAAEDINDRVRVYVDGVAGTPTGVPNASVPMTPLKLASTGLFIGQRQSVPGRLDSNSALVGGTLDDLTLWNRVLTTKEIQQIEEHSFAFAATDPNLQGYWPLNEGAGSIAKDRSSHGNDATLGTGSMRPSWTELSHISYTPRNEGEFYLSVIVFDGDGGFDSVTTPFFVLNVNPTIIDLNESSTTAVVGTPLAFDARSVTDPGFEENFTYLWEVISNNGQPIQTSSDLEFQFTPRYAGRYIVQLTVTDSFGGSTLFSLPLDAAPTVEITPPTETLLAGNIATFGSDQSSPMAPSGTSARHESFSATADFVGGYSRQCRRIYE